MSATCKSCGAPIRWEITAAGKRIPLDEQPSANGNMVIEGEGHERKAIVASPLFSATTDRYMPHHATCPQGRQWRR